jgi:hypothetical protein
MTRKLPDNADLGQLRTQAKELRRAAAGGNPTALARIRAFLSHATGESSAPGQSSAAGESSAPGESKAPAGLPLRDAQFVIAREYGYPGWRELAAAVVVQQTGGRDLHRWFGVELNNEVWDTIDNGLGPDSSPEEQEQALFAAYASAFHWRQIGTVANLGRGEHLVASVAAAVGLLEVAGRHARRYQELIDAHPAAFTDWDRGFAAEALARVAALQGSPDAARLRDEAQAATDAIADPEDRDIVQNRLTQPPW